MPMRTHNLILQRGDYQNIPITQVEECECGEWAEGDAQTHADHVRNAVISDAADLVYGLTDSYHSAEYNHGVLAAAGELEEWIV